MTPSCSLTQVFSEERHVFLKGRSAIYRPEFGKPALDSAAIERQSTFQLNRTNAGLPQASPGAKSTTESLEGSRDVQSGVNVCQMIDHNRHGDQARRHGRRSSSSLISGIIKRLYIPVLSSLLAVGSARYKHRCGSAFFFGGVLHRNCVGSWPQPVHKVDSTVRPTLPIPTKNPEKPARWGQRAVSVEQVSPGSLN